MSPKIGLHQENASTIHYSIIHNKHAIQLPLGECHVQSELQKHLLALPFRIPVLHSSEEKGPEMKSIWMEISLLFLVSKGHFSCDIYFAMLFPGRKKKRPRKLLLRVQTCFQ